MTIDGFVTAFDMDAPNEYHTTVQLDIAARGADNARP